MVGKISLHIPNFVAQTDSSLLSFYGLRGERNRQKLAETFLRPMTWKEYCETVSTTNCTAPDEVAQRYPYDGEYQSYFADNDYFGYFRATDRNNCTAHPSTCTGHVVAAPCEWSTNLDSQLYWNSIALESNGPLEPTSAYAYESMVEIWKAANKTNSNVIMWWWRPDPLVEEFRGDAGEFQQILLPEATAECGASRVSSEARCSSDIRDRRGNRMGACDDEAHKLQTIVSSALRKQVEASPNPIRSPAYEAIKNIKITDLEVSKILQMWRSRRIDTYGYDARDAVCSWVVEHFEELQSFVPSTYPRKLNDNNANAIGRTILLVVGSLGTVTVLLALYLAYRYRERRAFVYSQVHFCYLVLVGLLWSAIGANFYLMEPPTTLSCTATEWLFLLGLTLQLAPLLVKFARVNGSRSSRRRNLVKIKSKDFSYVVLSVVIVVVYLVIWTVIDTPMSVERYILSGDPVPVVTLAHTCASKLDFWKRISLGWIVTLLAMALVLAIQTRNVAGNFIDTKCLL